jgi:hypothetical protein
MYADKLSAAAGWHNRAPALTHTSPYPNWRTCHPRPEDAYAVCALLQTSAQHTIPAHKCTLMTCPAKHSPPSMLMHTAIPDSQPAHPQHADTNIFLAPPATTARHHCSAAQPAALSATPHLVKHSSPMHAAPLVPAQRLQTKHRATRAASTCNAPANQHSSRLALRTPSTQPPCYHTLQQHSADCNLQMV